MSALENGRLFSRSDPSKGETFGELFDPKRAGSVEGKAEAKPGSEKERYSMYAFGVQFAEVHVDADLGQVKVARMLVALARERS